MLQTPIVLFIYKRPQTTERVLAEIARVKPQRLFVIADGPKSNEEAEICAKARSLIERVDWDCEVLTNFSEVNLKSGQRVSSGINWVFEQCEEAIILKMIVCHIQVSFGFCQELLENIVIMTSDDDCRDQLASRQAGIPDSYYFLNMLYLGMGNPRRAWRHYDLEIGLWPSLRKTDWLQKAFDHPVVTRFCQERFDEVCAGEVDTWDIQWFFTCLVNDGLSITPNVNLITNIGAGSDSTHFRERIEGITHVPPTR
jgi:hypothetical protein